MTSKAEDWLFKCRQCKHYYQVQNDADEVRCRLKYCKFKPTCDDVTMKILERAQSGEKI